LEKQIDFVSHMVESNFIKKENALKLVPITDAMGFILAISNTWALSWALFTSSSPLMKDLQDLYEIIVKGYQNGELEAVCTPIVELIQVHLKVFQFGLA